MVTRRFCQPVFQYDTILGRVVEKVRSQGEQVGYLVFEHAGHKVSDGTT
jgi:hypothetical protein